MGGRRREERKKEMNNKSFYYQNINNTTTTMEQQPNKHKKQEEEREEEDDDVLLDLAPRAGRLVLHWSDSRVPTRVLPVYGSERFACTLWFLDSVERRRFLGQSDVADKERGGGEVIGIFHADDEYL